VHKSLISTKGFNYLALGIFLLVIGLFTDLVFSIAIIYMASLCCVMVIEYRSLYSSNDLKLSISSRRNEIVDEEFDIEFFIDIYSKNYSEVELELSELELPVEILGIDLANIDQVNKRHFILTYKVNSKFYRIGSYKFENIKLISKSPFALWVRNFDIEAPNTIQHIWPKKEKIDDNELKKIFQEQAFLGSRTGMAQFNISREIFFGMRDYQHGDSLRVIDAKKSARYSRPITKMYEEIKSNNIFLFIDLGRNMEGRLDDSELLNYYFYVMLSIAQTALELGDKVTLCGISDKVEFIYPNLNSLESLKAVMTHAYKVRTNHTQTNYHLVNQVLEKYHVKRSLVIFLSDFTKPSVQESVKEIMNYLSIKHIPLLLSLLDDQFDIDNNIENHIDDSDDYKRLVYSIAIKEKLELFSKELSNKGAFHFNVTANKWMDFAPKAFKLVRESFIS